MAETAALAIQKVPAWKLIRLGLHQKADAYRRALFQARCNVTDWADDLLSRCTFAASEGQIDVSLALVSVAELGFTQGANYSDICTRALEVDLEICAPEVGPTLRLAYKEQPLGDCLTVAMNAIRGPARNLGLFALGRDLSGRWLGVDDGRRSVFWHSKTRFVFVLRG